MKKLFLTLILLSIFGCGYAQITIEECWDKARANYPLIVRTSLIDRAEQYNLANASRGYLPQLQMTARATYQSDVTSLPIELPGVEIPSLPKDNYDAKIEVTQLVWDGGRIEAGKAATQAASEVSRQGLEVDLYALRDRVNQLFFGILLLDKQLEQNRLLEEDLQRSNKQVSAYIQGGVANRSDLDIVEVEQINARQNRLSMESLREAYVEMLGEMIGEKGDLKLVPPAVSDVNTATVNRPELWLMDAQDESYKTQLQGIKAQNRPVLNLFAQGGYGQPGLNMLKVGFDTYYIAGVRLSWNFGNLYTKRNDMRLVENSRQSIAAQKQTFLFNTRLNLVSQERKADNIRSLMQEDNRLVELRGNIRKAAEAKVAAGTLSVTEMMREVMAENIAKQNRALHQVQLIMAIYDIKTTTNN